MNKANFIVPIPGTTKLSHLKENLRATDIVLTDTDMKELETAVSAIPVTGSRYDALQESKVQKKYRNETVSIHQTLHPHIGNHVPDSIMHKKQ